MKFNLHLGCDTWRAQEHIETMPDADIAASIGCPKTDAHSQQMCKRGDCKEKQAAASEQSHFPEHANRQVVQMCDVYRRHEHVGSSADSRRKCSIGKRLGQTRGGCA